MKQFAISLVALLAVMVFAEESSAQWVRYYRPRTFVAPRPVTRVYRAPMVVQQPMFVQPPMVVQRPMVVNRPMVVYQPTTVFYQRPRPILGGSVVRARPTYRRTVVW